MEIFMMKRRLLGGLCLLGLVVVVGLLVGMNFSQEVKEGLGGDEPYTLAKLVVMVGSATCLLIFLVYLFAEKLMEIRMSRAERPRCPLW